MSDSALPTSSARTENAGNPHYLPAASAEPDGFRQQRSWCCWILWGKLAIGPAPCTPTSRGWGYTGARVVPDRVRAGVRRRWPAARDAAVDAGAAQRCGAAAGAPGLAGGPRGVARCCAAAGFGDARAASRRAQDLRRADVHGNGVHMDDYETHDDTAAARGHGVHDRAGLYFPHFGVRTEVNMFVGHGEAKVSGPSQAAIVPLV